jgi:hypothetical protein
MAAWALGGARAVNERRELQSELAGCEVGEHWP